MASILYLSVMGMTESLGESQVVQYLLDLSKDNSIYLFSFEKPQNLKTDKYLQLQEKLKQANIQWDFSVYSNRFGILSTFWQIFSTFFILGKLIKKNKIEIIHARSLIPAVMGMLFKKIFHLKLLFDIRGFAIDEKIMDRRLKERSILTAMLKKLEAYTYKKSDHIVTLTHASKPIIANKYGNKQNEITVIPTCANQEIFKKISLTEKISLRKKMGFEIDDFIVIQNGSFNPSYDFEAQIKLCKQLSFKKPNSKFIFLNQGQHVFIQNLIEKFQLSKDICTVMAVDFNRVSDYLNISDLSIFFVKPTFAKQASAPTKFAEMIGCHLFSITNKKYGDMEFYLNLYNVGKAFDLNEIHSNTEQVANEVMTFFDDNHRNDDSEFDKLFSEHFSKEVAVKRYQQIYNILHETLLT